MQLIKGEDLENPEEVRNAAEENNIQWSKQKEMETSKQLKFRSFGTNGIQTNE